MAAPAHAPALIPHRHRLRDPERREGEERGQILYFAGSSGSGSGRAATHPGSR